MNLYRHQIPLAPGEKIVGFYKGVPIRILKEHEIVSDPEPEMPQDRYRYRYLYDSPDGKIIELPAGLDGGYGSDNNRDPTMVFGDRFFFIYAEYHEQRIMCFDFRTGLTEVFHNRGGYMFDGKIAGKSIDVDSDGDVYYDKFVGFMVYDLRTGNQKLQRGRQTCHIWLEDEIHNNIFHNVFTGMSVEIPVDGYINISYDGRFASYVDTTDSVLHTIDLKSGVILDERYHVEKSLLIEKSQNYTKVVWKAFVFDEIGRAHV